LSAKEDAKTPWGVNWREIHPGSFYIFVDKVWVLMSFEKVSRCLLREVLRKMSSRPPPGKRIFLPALNRVPPVAEDSLVSIEEGDRTFGGTRIL